MIIYRCLSCKQGRPLNVEETRDSIHSCEFCRSTYLQFYENNKTLEEMKGGLINMGKEKKEKVEKAPKEKKEKKPTITDVRVGHANAILALLKERGVAKEEWSAIISRSYSMNKSK